MQQHHSCCVSVLLLVLSSLSHVQPSVRAETDYYPGLRKPPTGTLWTSGQLVPNEKAYIIAQLTSIIEDQARRRFQINQRQLQHSQLVLRQQQAEEFQQNRLQHWHQQNDAPQFTYQFPSRTLAPLVGSATEQTPFAIGPDNPRFYEPIEPSADDNQMTASDENDTADSGPFAADYQEMLASANSAALTGDANGNKKQQQQPQQTVDKSAVHNVDMLPTYKLKAPMEIKPNVGPAVKPFERDDIKSLVQKLQSSGQASAIINSRDESSDGQHPHNSGVVRKHMDVNTVVDMYVVAIIAGISATVTVGLIAIGIGWYTLHKKSLAAADVEYPAYGVTGPNKDLSQDTSPYKLDRRLAQSAQMYHYQHQKQQIIAMEKNEHRTGALTDAESDEENEEGDYTVYECPGLAPTGEMEVKNPLFLDDPTPATPATVNANKPTNNTDNSKGVKK